MSSKLSKHREQRQLLLLLLEEIRREIIVLVQFKTKRCITAENKRPFLKEIVEYCFNLNYSEKNPVFESTYTTFIMADGAPDWD